MESSCSSTAGAREEPDYETPPGSEGSERSQSTSSSSSEDETKTTAKRKSKKSKTGEFQYGFISVA